MSSNKSGKDPADLADSVAVVLMIAAAPKLFVEAEEISLPLSAVRRSVFSGHSEAVATGMSGRRNRSQTRHWDGGDGRSGGGGG